MSDILFIIIYIVLGLTLGVSFWSVGRRALMVGITSGKVHGIPVRSIIWCIAATLICVLFLSFFLADTSDSRSIQKTIDPLWLRLSNMMVVTGLVCIIAAIAAIAFSFLHSLMIDGKNIVKNMFNK